MSYGGNELSYDYYNKRQISCLGVALLYMDNKELKTEYISYFSNILSKDSLFSSDVLDLFINELNEKYKKVHIFTDCGPHFRSKEFLYRVKKLSIEKNLDISLNFFAEYHGKSIVDGHFGRLSQIFEKIDYAYSIVTIEQLKEAFENEAKINNWDNLYFRIYHRETREKLVNKIGIKNIKLYLSYLFINGGCYYNFLTNFDDIYIYLDSNDTQEVDKRSTNLTPGRADDFRVKRYFNDRIHKLFCARIT